MPSCQECGAAQEPCVACKKKVCVVCCAKRNALTKEYYPACCARHGVCDRCGKTSKRLWECDECLLSACCGATFWRCSCGKTKCQACANPVVL
jgi:hypothetical protein